jgi:hypothetical protein
MPMGAFTAEVASSCADVGVARGPRPCDDRISWQAAGVIDDFAKSYLHDDLKWIRSVLLSKLDGLPEYDVRRPLTTTGTNLLGLVKHLSATEARYFGEIFDRPSPWPLPAWDSDEAWSETNMWATADETRADIITRYQLAGEFTDATIEALPIDAPGHVPWWPRPDVKLFNIIVHVLTETNRHCGHADILREHLDGQVGAGPEADHLHGHDASYWSAYRATVEQAAEAAVRRESEGTDGFRNTEVEQRHLSSEKKACGLPQ